MATTVALSVLRTRARQRADQENSGFITDTELNYYLNGSLAELYDLLVSVYDDEYFATSYSFNTIAQTETYALPAAHYKTLGLDLVLSSTQVIPLKKFVFGDRNKYKTALFNLQGSELCRYRLNGSNILLSPIPNSVHSLKLWYIPSFTPLSADGDTFDGINGWEEYAIVDAAIKMKIKEDSGIQELSYQKASLLERILKMRQNRDAGEPGKIANVRRYGRYLGGA